MHAPTHNHWIGALTIGAFLAACSDPSDCTQVEVPAVIAVVRDAANNAAITDGASGQIVSGSFQSTFGPYEIDAQSKPLSLAAYGPNGTYTVSISRPGYAPWDSVVTVSGTSACQVDRTQRITVRLNPL